MTRGDGDFMNWAELEYFSVPHAFTTEKIKSTTAEYVELRAN